MYDLEEQEQIDALKAWWKEHGRVVIAALVAACLAAGGTAGWRWYQRSQAEQASQIYSSLEKAVNANDLKQVRELSRQLTEQYGSSAYGPMAALVAAKAQYEAGDASGAQSALHWAVDHARDEDLEATGRLRLAGILLDQKKYDDALKVLEAKHPESFDGLFADLTGDIQAAQGKPAAARAAYQRALEKLPGGGYRDIVQVKLDSLGGSP